MSLTRLLFTRSASAFPFDVRPDFPDNTTALWCQHRGLTKIQVSLIHHHKFSDQKQDNMSDFEDEMDVDVPSKSIQFSADGAAGKQKRVVADLPIEVGDNLPWYTRILLPR